MLKFSEIKYERPDSEGLIRKIKEAVNDFSEAKSFGEADQIFLALNREQQHFDTMETIASIRNTVDTTDEFYEKEMEYFYQNDPRIAVVWKEFYQVFLDSEYLGDFEETYSSVYVEKIRNRVRLTDERIVDKQIEESMLVQEYSKTAASPTTVFHGEKVSFYGLLKYMQSTDRDIRKATFEEWAALYESIADRLDAIYSRLIRIRCEMAEMLGFSDYIEMAYRRMERYEYGPEQVGVFRNQICESVVPLCSRLFEEQTARLGVDTLHYYDEALMYPEGNAVPQGTTKELLEKAGDMYRELSEESGRFFDFMLDYELFDLETRPGKHQGGYCTSLLDYQAPFIFSNFNGTSADIDVLTHEAGHAFEDFVALRRMKLPELASSTSEINEIHSMSMEFFTYPWMELFFGEEADQYRRAHLESCLKVVPYMACVDEFQHCVYREMLTNAKDRRDVWHELEQKYLPWRNYDGNQFLGQGGFWMQKQHIFMYPFYYIDYALAQMGALEFYERMQENQKEAWEDYYRLCCAGGSKGYFELLRIGNLSNPFEEGTVGNIMRKLKV